MDKPINETINTIYKYDLYYTTNHIICFIMFILLGLVLFYHSCILKYNIIKYISTFYKDSKCNHIFVNYQSDKYNLNNCIMDKLNKKPEYIYILNLYNKLINLLEYVKKQLFLINKYNRDKKINNINYSNETIKNKLRYLKLKQDNINKLYKKIEEDYNLILEKINKGIKYNTTVEKEQQDYQLYQNKKMSSLILNN